MNKSSVVKNIALCIALVFLSTISFGQNIKNIFKANIFWRGTIVKQIKNNGKDFVMDIKYLINNYNQDTLRYTIVSADDDIAYISDGVCYYFDDSCVNMINNDCREIMKGSSKGRFYDVSYINYITAQIQYFTFYFNTNQAKHYNIVAIKDSIIEGTKYKIITRNKENSHYFNEKTKKYDIPNFHVIDYCYNCDKKYVDIIDVKAMKGKNLYEDYKRKYFINISYQDHTDYLKDIFNFNNPTYIGYSHHNDTIEPYSVTWTIPKNEKLNEDILNFPIKNLNGDKTSIKQESGWLLLDFWFFECRSCKEWMSSLANEKDSLGYRILEHNGIKIMSINALTDNIKKIKQEIIGLNCNDIIYYTKGLGNLLDISRMPKYYLISPDKKIVYIHTGKLIDYNDVIRAKESYIKSKSVISN